MLMEFILFSTTSSYLYRCTPYRVSSTSPCQAAWIAMKVVSQQCIDTARLDLSAGYHVTYVHGTRRARTSVWSKYRVGTWQIVQLLLVRLSLRVARQSPLPCTCRVSQSIMRQSRGDSSAAGAPQASSRLWASGRRPLLRCAAAGPRLPHDEPRAAAVIGPEQLSHLSIAASIAFETGAVELCEPSTAANVVPRLLFVSSPSLPSPSLMNNARPTSSVVLERLPACLSIASYIA